MNSRMSGTLDIHHGHLSYEVSGEGPPLIFLHGFSFDMRSWNAEAASLSDEFRVIRYDLRGFGRSSLPRKQYDHCADLAQLLAHLEVEKPILVGLSLGSNVALRYATLEPCSLDGLILASPGLPGHVWSTPRPPEEARAFAQANGVDAGKEFWLGHALFASLADYPQALAASREMLADYSGWHWREMDIQAPAAPLIPQLDSLNVRTLVISGDRDAEGYRDCARVIAVRIPGAELMTFPAAGHMLNLEQPDAFCAAIRSFARGGR